MGMSYKKFIEKNTSSMSQTIISEANNVVHILSNFLFVMSEVFVIVFIYSMLIYVNWKMTLLLTLFLGVNVILMKIFISTKIKKAGEERAFFQEKFFKILTDSFRNFKLIKLKSKDEEILKEFNQVSFNFANANIKNATLSQFPRLFLEMLGFSLVVFIVVYLLLKYQQDISAALPILMVFVLGLYRLMPSVNRIVSGINEIIFRLKALEVVHNELIYEIEELGDEEISFNEKIELKNISFEYEGSEIEPETACLQSFGALLS